MFKRVINCRLPLIVNSPAKVFDINYFKAVHESGALPLLDTEYFDYEENLKILDELRGEKILFAVKISCGDEKLINIIAQNNIINLDLIVFSYSKPDDLDSMKITNRFYKYFVEARDIEINSKLEQLHLNGLILKGNEAKGNVSKYTSYILMQWYLENSGMPVFISGGAGMHTSSGMFAAGCCGIVLDSQLYLTDEAPVAKEYKDLIAKLDEKDTVVIGDYIDSRYRVFAKLGTKVVKELKEKESEFYLKSEKLKVKTESLNVKTENSKQEAGNLKPEAGNLEVEKEIRDRLVAIDKPSANPLQELFFLGQDAMFAKHFVKGSTKLRDVIHNFFKVTGENLGKIDEHDPMVKGSRLTLDHVTTYPVIQGPMGNISDNADFANEIFKKGGLPFFAMGNLPKSIAENVIRTGSEKVDNFGAGLIGLEFNKPLNEHIELIKQYKVKFAIVAGGVPSQVNELEKNGIKAYLHTPSMQILENAIKSCTAHRFIFEGTEAGGHVGNLTSTVLWELAIERLISQNVAALKKQSLIFAGGISCKSGSAFISGMTSHIASLGAKVGISVATAYMFSKEIVETKAMKKVYQDVIRQRKDSVVIANTIGLPTRTVLTPFTEDVLMNEHKWIKDRKDLNERKSTFEALSSGSLLIAAKAFTPNFGKKNGDADYIFFNDDEQYKKGNFMTGDTLALYNEEVTIDDIHNTLFNTKDFLYNNLNCLEVLTDKSNELNDEIAVIGMAGIYPDAENLTQFWQNIITKKYSITEIPEDRAEISLYYNKDIKLEDMSYSHIAGVIKDFRFDHKKFGYTEEEAKYIGRSQKMILQTAADAVEEAGYGTVDGPKSTVHPDKSGLHFAQQTKEKTLPKTRTGVIVGNCLETEFIERHHKYSYPEIENYLYKIDAFKSLNDTQKKALLQSIKDNLCKEHLNEKFENTMLNINAARISKHLGLEGTNYSVDAACATSFVAVDCAIKSLLSNEYDYMLVGGISTNLTPELLVGFSKMTGLSDEGSYPFDERANGFVLGEGSGVLVLKRMKDAVRDNDKIHAVIKGVGTSSDGKGKAIAAPSSAGQAYALNRCFEKIKTEISFDDIDYIEAHGTSTLAGDAAEIQTIKNVYKTTHPVGISSIKSQIGHLLSGAGLAGITKVILAIENKTLPPNGQFKKLSEKINIAEPFYIIDKPKEWKIKKGKTRKAGISSFGFGGINTHVVVEEFTPEYKILKRNIFADTEYDFNDDRIVIVGTGCLLPDAFTTEAWWNNLQTGKQSFYDIPENRININAYSSQEDKAFALPKIKAGLIKDFKFNGIKYKIPPATLKYIDKHQLYGVEAASQAIEQAAIKDKLANGNKVGVVIGNTMSGEFFYETICRIRIPSVCKAIEDGEWKMENGEKIKKEIAEKLTILLRDRFFKSTEDTFPGYIANLISGRIANVFNCNGSNFIVDSASASSANAISLAIKGIKNNDYEYVITGGVDTNFTPSVLKGMQQWGMLSANGTDIFSKNENGVSVAEGAVMFVMTRLSTAKKNNMKVLAEVNDFTITAKNSDTMLTTPDRTAYQNTIDQFYERNAIVPSQVSFMEVYGAGNVLFDMMEQQVVENRFSNSIYFGNIKSGFGYLKSAHPAAVLLKLVMMNNNKKILPNYLEQKNSIVSNGSVMKFNNEAVTINSDNNRNFAANIFGIGGNHGHFVVSNIPFFLEENLKLKTQNLKLQSQNQIPETQNSQLPTLTAALLSGQGSQYVGMMKELYETEEIFRTIIDRGERIFIESKGYSIKDIMFGNEEQLIRTGNTQPAIFLATAAIFDYLKSKGFTPDRYIGHSLGEFSALYCAGILGFDEAFQLVIKRAELMQEAADLNPGSMVAVLKDEVVTESLVKESNIKNIFLANKNSLEQTVVSGANEGITEFMKFLKEKNVTHAKVNVATAFHTPFFSEASKKLREYLANVSFNHVAYNNVYSNVTGELYPQDENKIKDLLAEQMVSPVEFVKILKNASSANARIFAEAGPNKILTNLVKKTKIETEFIMHSVDPKIGEKESLEAIVREMEKLNILKPVIIKPTIEPQLINEEKPIPMHESKPESLINFNKDYIENSAEFSEYINEKKEEITNLLYKNFLNYKKEKAYDNQNRLGLFSGSIVIAGVSVGLPGSGYKVFDSDNFNKVLAGVNFIEALTDAEKERIFDKHITRLNKESDGSAKFQELKNTDEVIQLAAKLGYFDLKKEYGIDFSYDITYSLAIAAGIEALKDANIPLVMQYKKTSSGSLLPKGYALPKEMQDRTGVIFSSVFHGFESIIDEVTKYFKDKFINKPLNEFENIYFYLMEHVKDVDIKRAVTTWFADMKNEAKGNKPYEFNRKLLLDIAALGSTHFAQIIKAKGPNTQISATCTSTTQAIGIAEDWIRTNRCDRVIIIGGEAATSEKQQEWIGASFLSIGAATDKRIISEAALPFDARRSGLVLGSAAVSVIIEKEEEIKKRGLNGEAFILSTYIGNSAYHASKIDSEFFAVEMKKFFDRTEKLYNLKKDVYTKSLLFMSHESYTPGQGGPATAEVQALKRVFPDHYKNISITNIKGFTGSTLGAAAEDAVMVKALQKGKAPALANLKEIPDEFNEIKFCDGKDAVYEYGVHLAAGFGSYFSFLFIKRIVENSVNNNPKYIDWLKSISSQEDPEIAILNNTLIIKADKTQPAAKPKEMPAEKEIQKQPEPVKIPVAQPIVFEQKQETPVKAAVSTLPTQNSELILNDIKSIIAEQTGYTVDLLENELDLEADLGIDTVKQVEIFGKITAKFNLEVPENLKLNKYNTISKIADFVLGSSSKSEPGSQKSEPVEVNEIPAILPPASEPQTHTPVLNSQFSILNSDVVLNDIKSIIAEQTGYTVDLLENELDLEADLGIDTVKQVEIFGKITAKFNLEVPENLKLNKYNTISKIADFVIGSSSKSDDGSQKSEEGKEQSTEIIAETTQTTQPTEKAITTDDLRFTNIGVNIPKEIKAIISEQTGYETDMLENDLDLEADLGIDTVKQVEIFGKIMTRFNIAASDNIKMNKFNTISKIVEFVAGEIFLPKLSAINEEPVPAAVPVPEPVIEKSDTVILSEIKVPLNGNVIKEIRKVISELTGNPVEKLGEKMNLESEFGIDSVKMVEVCQRVSKVFKFTVPENFRLSELATISDIEAFVKRRVSAVESFSPAAKSDTSHAVSKVKRLVVDAVRVNATGHTENIFSGKTFLISRDKLGFADALIQKIIAFNGKAITIGNNDTDNYRVNFFEPASVEAAIANILSSETVIDGIIHLLPLETYFEQVSDTEAINVSIKSFFLVIKSLYDRLNRKGTLVSTLTFDSVIFPYTGEMLNIHPVFAGISGMLKSVHKELPESIVKTVDFRYDNILDSIPEIIDTYVSELMSRDMRAEVGYSDSQKFALRLNEMPLKCKDPHFIKEGSTLLITGGGKGISFEIAKELVKKFKVNLVILDITNLSSIDKRYIKEVTDEKIIFTELKEKMSGAKPLDIKNAVENISKVRETILNIEYLKSLGTDIFYETVNVCDLTTLKIILSNYPDIDGVIHAAGLEDSTLIPKKSFAVFSRVINVKIMGALNLIHALENTPYKFFLTFASVAGKFGNHGQTDYAAANDMLCKLVKKESLRHPDKNYKVYNWTAWKGTGMANKETIIKVLTDQGIDFLEISQGIKFFIDELTDTEATEAVFTGINPALDTDGIFTTEPAGISEIKVYNEFCFIDKIIRKDETSCESIYTFSADRDFYLDSYIWEDSPVVPPAFLSELMIQNSRILAPFMHALSITSFKMIHPLRILHNGKKQVKIISSVSQKNSDVITISSKIFSDIKDSKGDITEKDKLHCEAEIVFNRVQPPASKFQLPANDFREFQNVKSSVVSTFYSRSLLFMGPKMQTISRLMHIDNKLAIAEVRYSDTNILSNGNSKCFTLDPIILDACLQTSMLLTGIYYKHSVLTESIDSIIAFDKIESSSSYFAVAILKNSNDLITPNSQLPTHFVSDIILFDRSWKPVLFISGFRSFADVEVSRELLATINNELVLAQNELSSYTEFIAKKVLVDKKITLPFAGDKAEEAPGKLVFRRTLDLSRDIFLSHHVKSDVPLFLGATGVEAMAEAAFEFTGRNKKVIALSNFSIPYGIKILKGRPKDIFITAEATADSSRVSSSIFSVFINKNGVKIGDTTVHYEGVYSFGDEYPQAPSAELPHVNNFHYDGKLRELLYHPDRLFMDEMFETIENILHSDNNTILAKLHNKNDHRCFSDRDDNNFITDVITLDGMFQTCGVIEMLSTNNLVLPYKIASMKIYADVTPDNEYLCLTRKTDERSDGNDYRIQLFSMDHKLLFDIEKMTMIKVGKLSEEAKINDKVNIAI